MISIDIKVTNPWADWKFTRLCYWRHRLWQNTWFETSAWFYPRELFVIQLGVEYQDEFDSIGVYLSFLGLGVLLHVVDATALIDE